MILTLTRAFDLPDYLLAHNSSWVGNKSQTVSGPTLSTRVQVYCSVPSPTCSLKNVTAQRETNVDFVLRPRQIAEA